MIRERVVEIGRPSLSGVLTPTETESDLALVLLNSGLLHRVGASRLNVTLARDAVQQGIDALRFDFSGIGESPPRRGGKGVKDRSVGEVQEVLDFLTTTRGTRGFILAGLCSGAEIAFETAVMDPRVVAVLQLDPLPPRTARATLHRIAPKLFRAESWKNVVTGKTYLGAWVRDGDAREAETTPGLERDLLPENATLDETEKGLGTLMSRGVRLYNVYTGAMELYTYKDQFREAYPRVDFGDRLQVDFLPEADHEFTNVADQEYIVRTAREWLSKVKQGHGQAAGPTSKRTHEPTRESTARVEGTI